MSLWSVTVYSKGFEAYVKHLTATIRAWRSEPLAVHEKPVAVCTRVDFWFPMDRRLRASELVQPNETP